MMPIAERDQFAVEFYLTEDSPLEKTAAICDSMETILRQDERVKSVSAFIGTSSPRFHIAYSPNMPSKNYGQFVVNTVSNKATEAILDEYTNKYAFYFPEAYVKFRQLEFQLATAPIEVRFISDNIYELKTQADKLTEYLHAMDECLWVRTSFDAPSPAISVQLNQAESGRLGINKTLASLGIASALSGIKITDLWEGNYAVPVVLQPDNSENNISSLENVQISGTLGASVPLRQFGALSPQWNESVITHQNGIRSLCVLADVKRDAYPNKVFKKVKHFVEHEIVPELPADMKHEYGGLNETEDEVMGSLYLAVGVALIIMFFVLIFHFCKLKLAIIIMLSITLSVFGAAFGVWLLKIDFSAFAILGIIGLAGIIIRNGIIMYDYIEHLRFNKNVPVRQAAFDAGKRRMRPVFLTSAVAAMGVLPMIISASPMWQGMATILFFGILISMIFVVTVLPVVYWKLYEK